MQQTEAIVASPKRMSSAQYGSDHLIELFSGLGIPYVALNPGSSYRGLHDSFVNFPDAPEMVLCCHEEIAVAVAHGYARVTGRPLLAAVHDVVGLQHATMAIYNAWCDRIPIIVIGGTGPMAVENRRNGIDWVHTANVQGNIVRDIVKWDDQPASIAGLAESVLRGYKIAMTEPHGPVYLCFDVDLQEAKVTAPINLPDFSRFQPPAPLAPDADSLARVAEILAKASFPVILADGVGRHREAIPFVAELAELLEAPVVSTGGRFNIASNHRLNLSGSRREVLGKADVVLALDVFDLSGALGPGIGPERDEPQFISEDCTILHIGVWDLLQHSLISDYARLAPVDVSIAADTAAALPLLVAASRRALEADSGSRSRVADRAKEVENIRQKARERAQAASDRNRDTRPISMERVSSDLWDVVQKAGVPWSFVSGGPRGGGWTVTEPEHITGGGRGAGLGQAAGIAVGASIAHKGSGRLCISIIGDGDFLYTPQSLWTASNQRLPLLTIVNNNKSYGNDEGHQEYIARTRGRPLERRGIGVFIEDPKTNFAHLARAFDIEGFGPVEDPAEVRGVLEHAVNLVTKERRPVLVDVSTQRRIT
jgi:acetolactate synthase-1/2/3 large subunit